MNANLIGILVVRTFIFGVLLLVIYLFTAPISIPSVLGLGEVRVLIVSVVANLLEQGFYSTLKNSVLHVEKDVGDQR